jgi:hypothetical protein
MAREMTDEQLSDLCFGMAGILFAVWIWMTA